MDTASSISADHYFGHKRLEMLEFVPLSARRVLDVGCGSGAFVRALSESLNAEFWGVELSPDAARARFPGFHRYLVGSITDKLSELPDRYFDCIVFNDVLEHLMEPFSVLEVLKRKLTPAGVIVASVPNVRYIKNLVHLLVEKDWKYQDEGILDRTHLRFFTRKSLLRSLTENGWNVQTCKGISPTRMKFAFWALNLATFGFMADTQYMNHAIVASPVEAQRG
jgi:2-polyprenyl-3-methyl-5-hydroxy-6-metoxy-1,4-benzoquinol methylase